MQLTALSRNARSSGMTTIAEVESLQSGRDETNAGPYTTTQYSGRYYFTDRSGQMG